MDSRAVCVGASAAIRSPPSPVWSGWPAIPVTTHPADRQMASPGGEVDALGRDPLGHVRGPPPRRDPRYRQRGGDRPGVEPVPEPVVGEHPQHPTGRERRVRCTSTRPETADGTIATSAPACRTATRRPSVQKTSPVNGSADAATITPDGVRRATLTATSGVWAAKLSVPQNGSTNHVRSAPTAPTRPLSSPSTASPGRAVRTISMIRSSASTSATVAKSPPPLSRRGNVRP